MLELELPHSQTARCGMRVMTLGSSAFAHTWLYEFYAFCFDDRQVRCVLSEAIYSRPLRDKLRYVGWAASCKRDVSRHGTHNTRGAVMSIEYAGTA